MQALIIVYERITLEGGNVDNPICVIRRSMDGEQAYDLAVSMVDGAVIVNGAYDDMPANEYNGPGQLAKALLLAINEGWETTTSLCPISEVLDEGGNLLEQDDSDYDDEMVLAVYAPCPIHDSDAGIAVSFATHSIYDI